MDLDIKTFLKRYYFCQYKHTKFKALLQVDISSRCKLKAFIFMMECSVYYRILYLKKVPYTQCS